MTLPGRRRTYAAITSGYWIHVDDVWALVTKTRRVELLGVPHLHLSLAGPDGDSEHGPVPETDVVQACTRVEAMDARLSLLGDL